jgi:anti-sigma factor RsiW
MDMREHGRALSRYRDGEVGPEEAARIEAHLEGCDDCRRAADVIDAVRTHLKAISPPAPPEDLSTGVIRRIRSQSARILTLKTQLRLTAAAASVLLVATLAVVPLVIGTQEPAAKPGDSIAEVAVEELMLEVVKEYQPGVPTEEEDR